MNWNAYTFKSEWNQSVPQQLKRIRKHLALKCQHQLHDIVGIKLEIQPSAVVLWNIYAHIIYLSIPSVLWFSPSSNSLPTYRFVILHHPSHDGLYVYFGNSITVFVESPGSFVFVGPVGLIRLLYTFNIAGNWEI